MKFWKILRELLDEIFPEWQDKFISYKDLKKQLKSIHPTVESSKNVVSDGDERTNKRPRLGDDEIDGSDERKEAEEEMGDLPNERPRLGDDRIDGGDQKKEVIEQLDAFVKLLDGEIKKFNKFFMDKEEDYVIRLKVLKDDIAEAKDSKEELMKIGRKMVDFHGEMILLENYSALNYTGLLKILKKYDKRSGDLIRLPFIQKVLNEPFFRTEVINKLVKECEVMLSRIFSRHKQLAPHEDTDQREECSEQQSDEREKRLRVPEELAEIECMENMYLKLSISALRAMKQIRGGSSTVSMFSLPPMQGTDLDESSKKSDVVDQEEK